MTEKELDAIRTRFEESEERPYEPELAASAADVPALLVEIERLQIALSEAWMIAEGRLLS